MISPKNCHVRGRQVASLPVHLRGTHGAVQGRRGLGGGGWTRAEEWRPQGQGQEPPGTPGTLGTPGSCSTEQRGAVFWRFCPQIVDIPWLCMGQNLWVSDLNTEMNMHFQFFLMWIEGSWGLIHPRVKLQK